MATTKAIGQFVAFMDAAARSGRGLVPTEAEKGLKLLGEFGASKADATAVQRWLRHADAKGFKIDEASRQRLEIYVTDARSQLFPGLLRKVKSEFARINTAGLIEWSTERPPANFGTRFKEQALLSGKHRNDPTYMVMVRLDSPAAPNGNQDPNRAEQFYVMQIPAGGPTVRVRPTYAGPFPMPGVQDTWVPPPDWDPHPVALYSVAVDRAIRSGNDEAIRNTLRAVDRAMAKVQGGPTMLRAMSLSTAAADNDSAVMKQLLKHRAKLQAAMPA